MFDHEDCANAEWSLTLPESITNVSLVEMRPGANQPNDAKFKCVIGGTTHTYTVAGGSHPEWVRVYAGTPGTLTAIKGQRTASNTGGAISGIRVNGVILVDGRPDNSFHLKFDAGKPIGYNSFDDTSFTSFTLSFISCSTVSTTCALLRSVLFDHPSILLPASPVLPALPPCARPFYSTRVCRTRPSRIQLNTPAWHSLR